MKFYVSIAFRETKEAIEIARAAEDLGYDGVGIPDHVINLETLATPYPYTRDGKRRWEAFTEWPDPWVLVGATALAPNVFTVGSQFAGRASLTDIAISPDGDRIYVANPGDGSVSVIDATTGEVLPGIQATDVQRESPPQRILFAPDGSQAYVVDQLGGIHVISFADSAVNV